MKLSTLPSFAFATLFIAGAVDVGAFVPVAVPVAVLVTSARVSERSSFVASPSATIGLYNGNVRRMGQDSSTTLAMQGNFFERFYRVFNANANKIISTLEDPEKVITQAVDDMQNDLIRVRQTYAESTARQRRLQKQKEQAEVEGEGWYNRANLALRRGNEGLAREALSRRQAFVDKASSLEAQLKAQRDASDKLYDAMMSLESKIKEAASKKSELISRARTAKSMQQVNDMLSGLGTGKNSMAAFNRMEEKVEALEAAAEASADITLIPDSTIESEFRLLESSSEVENELAKMKTELKMLAPGEDGEFISSFANTEKESIKIPISRLN